MIVRYAWRAALAVLVALAAASPPPATAAPTDYQAEDATISQGVVESNHTGYTGSGFVNYDNLVGSYVEWTVSAPAGPADVTLRYANGTAAAGRWTSPSTASPARSASPSRAPAPGRPGRPRRSGSNSRPGPTRSAPAPPPRTADRTRTS